MGRCRERDPSVRALPAGSDVSLIPPEFRDLVRKLEESTAPGPAATSAAHSPLHIHDFEAGGVCACGLLSEALRAQLVARVKTITPTPAAAPTPKRKRKPRERSRFALLEVDDGIPIIKKKKSKAATGADQ